MLVRPCVYSQSGHKQGQTADKPDIGQPVDGISPVEREEILSIDISIGCIEDPGEKDKQEGERAGRAPQKSGIDKSPVKIMDFPEQQKEKFHRSCFPAVDDEKDEDDSESRQFHDDPGRAGIQLQTPARTIVPSIRG